METITSANNRDFGSTLAPLTDGSFWMITAVSAFFFIGIVSFMLFCVFKFNHRKNPKASPIHGNVLLEVMWTVVPTIIVILMFFQSYTNYRYSKDVPADAFEIDVTAAQWVWNISYPAKDGREAFAYTSKSRPALEGMEQNSETLLEPKSTTVFKKWVPAIIVPVNTNIKLNLGTKDVIHSFYCPGFRIKADCMPKPPNGKKNYVWFNAVKEGQYDVYCTEFCGIEHSQMNTYIRVVSQKEFDAFLTDMAAYNKRVEESMPGFVIYKNNCAQCHTKDGDKGIGPSFKGVLTRTRAVVTDKGENLSNVKADLEYIAESIRNPKAKTVSGYQVGMMPNTFAGYTDEQVKLLYEYFETLK